MAHVCDAMQSRPNGHGSHHTHTHTHHTLPGIFTYTEPKRHNVIDRHQWPGKNYRANSIILHSQSEVIDPNAMQIKTKANEQQAIQTKTK